MSTPIWYAPPVPWYRGYRLQRWLIRLLIIAAITCGSVWAFRLVQQLHFLYQQRQWMRYSMPDDRIVLAEGTPEVQQLLNLREYHRVTPNALYPRQAAAYNPPADIDWAQEDACVFLHARRALGGHERLVTVGLSTQLALLTGDGYQLAAAALRPATLRPGSRQEYCSAYLEHEELELPGGSLRIFAGQPDPADESHFTIRYDLDGKSNTIDGWLMPDDTVKLEPRK
jgi:hypothetical protein